MAIVCIIVFCLSAIMAAISFVAGKPVQGLIFSLLFLLFILLPLYKNSEVVSIDCHTEISNQWEGIQFGSLMKISYEYWTYYPWTYNWLENTSNRIKNNITITPYEENK